MPTISIGSDYTFFDNPKTVSLTNPDATTVASKTAIKRVVSMTPGEQNGFKITNVACVWHVWVANLGSFVPVENGFITETDGTKHYIDKGGVSWETLETRFRLQTTAQAGAGVDGV